MAVIFNQTKCSDCVHEAACVKRKSFFDLFKAIEAVYITENQNYEMNERKITNEYYEANILIFCDYFIKNQNYCAPNGLMLLCMKWGRKNDL